MWDKIKQLQPITFNGLNKLKVINFSCNELTEIDQSTFNGLCNIEYIWFHDNILDLPDLKQI